MPLRPTRDIDPLGFGLVELPHVLQVFHEICAVAVAVDGGIIFNPDSVTAALVCLPDSLVLRRISVRTR